jgi:hypothetical protein
VAPKGNGWDEWKQVVLTTLDRTEVNIKDLSNTIKELDAKVDALCLNYASFKSKMEVKSGIWGVMGGALSAILMAIIYFITKK